ncbi:D-glycero-beta-D-manno-heptose 1,7-bisphosphate 7-phosphatase [Candidatus Pseudothioglobus singularis]|jgi:D-glycero-D-manno-heptose 1,7-bisphosphate phosphatase|nr:D-glycero-beta-D-manno-heptose 1,7-bisphosphate 7-phosphatase [Candidatus Pseudothioglobus singularis]
MPIKTIFLDRDGVINEEVNYLHETKDFKFINGIFQTCLYFKKLNYKIIVITNQSGIGRGLYTENDFQKITTWMLKQFKKNGVDILEVYHCPHLPDGSCDCRKPKPGMFLESKNKHNIDMKSSWMIGDKEIDITSANNAGITNTILVRSGHKIDEESSQAKYIIDSICHAREIISEY